MIRCPHCNAFIHLGHFDWCQEVTGKPADTHPDTMTCPTCAATQAPCDVCGLCGAEMRPPGEPCHNCGYTIGHQGWCPKRPVNTKPATTASALKNTKPPQKDMQDIHPDFDGAGYEREYDLERLTAQKDKIFEVMRLGEWFTLGALTALTGAPEASASAMIRAFRQGKHGGHTVTRRRLGEPTNGLWEYRLIVRPQQGDLKI